MYRYGVVVGLGDVMNCLNHLTKFRKELWQYYQLPNKEESGSIVDEDRVKSIWDVDSSSTHIYF